jgi:hypothetical protein
MNIVSNIFYYNLKYPAQVPTQIISIKFLKSGRINLRTGLTGQNRSPVEFNHYTESKPVINILLKLIFREKKESNSTIPIKTNNPHPEDHFGSQNNQPRRADHCNLSNPFVKVYFRKVKIKC